MKAAIYDAFRQPLSIRELPDPRPPERGVVIEVRATGLCRSDWHGWMGHDPDITPPHVPGHELSGIVAEVGPSVTRWRGGERVTLPFCCGCGHCEFCRQGDPQVCDRQFQPGFTHWGSFASLVAVDYADTNLVALPEAIDFTTGAGLGCRFATSFRAVVDQGRVRDEEWVAIHGCGGVGLAAVMIASALGARVVGIDIDDAILAMARELGAAAVVNAEREKDVAGRILAITNGGAHLSLDALGSRDTCLNAINSLRKRGRHVQVGLMTDDHRTPPVPMDLVIGRELEILGSHGMQARAYPRMLDMITDGRLHPERLIADTVSLEEAAVELTRMDGRRSPGVLVMDRL